ncbi:MAG: SRPBCC family protein [Haliea sp.]
MTMTTIEAQHDFRAPPQTLWDLIADFGNIEAWWPAGGAVNIERVELEGTGIGMVRHIYNEGMPAPVSERLDHLDPAALVWRLSIVGTKPAGLLQYQATGRITALDDGGSRVEYLGEFEAEAGGESQAREFLQGAYALMFNGLEQAAAARVR